MKRFLTLLALVGSAVAIACADTATSEPAPRPHITQKANRQCGWSYSGYSVATGWYTDSTWTCEQ